MSTFISKKKYIVLELKKADPFDWSSLKSLAKFTKIRSDSQFQTCYRLQYILWKRWDYFDSSMIYEMRNGVPHLPTSKVLVLNEKSANDVAKNMIESEYQKEPFYIFDFDVAYDHVKKFRDALPRVQIFYAMKSNDYSMMVKLAIALDLGFDCASPAEINKIRKHNVRPTSIIYAAPVKTSEEMVFARKSGVRHTTFDSSCELNKLKQYWPDARLLIRLKLDSNSVYMLNDKFGCEFTEAVELLEEAAQIGMTVIGVAFHVGSGCFSDESYTQGLQLSRALFDHEAEKGRKMSILDIGGGFFHDDTDRFDQVTCLINSGIAKWFSDPNIQIIAEPGRYISESAFTLYSSIRDVRSIVHFGKTLNIVYLDNTAHGTLRFIEKWHKFEKFKSNKDIVRTEDVLQDTIIFGPTADEDDALGPFKLHSCSKQDWLVFHQQGSYCLTFESNFCGRTPALTRSVISSKLWNLIKHNPVFSLDDFVMDSKMPQYSLPSVLPPFIADNGKYVNTLACKTASVFNSVWTMKDQNLNNFSTKLTSTYVLENHTPDDVAKAIIDNGKQKQPFYIFDLDEVFRRIQHFKDLMPRVKIFYAMKSNDTDIMLRLAVALGLSFDCASPGEIYKLRKLNVNPKNIIYAMACKTGDEMEYARKTGVKLTTFDSLCELKKIKQYWPDAKLLIRIRVDGKARRKLGLKFGCDFETEAFNLVDEAASLGLKVVGVAFHVGGMCYSPESYELGLRNARALFDHEEKAGRRMEIVDIGGGFLSDRTDRIDEVSQLINKTLEELFPDPTVQVIAEPGRYVCDSAFKMFCNVVSLRRGIWNNVPVNMVYINNGVFGTMMYDESWHKLRKFQRSTKIEPDVDEEVILWGPTCDSADRVMQGSKVKLPRCAPGDWLTLENHGAYSFSYSTRFSSINVPLIQSVVSKDLWNYIKNSSAFEPSHFVLNPDISSPLPSNLPPILPMDAYYNSAISIIF